MKQSITVKRYYKKCRAFKFKTNSYGFSKKTQQSYNFFVTTTLRDNNIKFNQRTKTTFSHKPTQKQLVYLKDLFLFSIMKKTITGLQSFCREKGFVFPNSILYGGT